MFRSVTLLLALSAASSASFLPFFGRQAGGVDPVGFFKLKSGNLRRGACPTNITHNVGPTDSEIPHGGILMSGLGCSEGSLSILSESDLLDALEGADARNTVNDFSNRIDGDIIYGLEREGRECASLPPGRRLSNFSVNTLVLIFKPEKQVAVNFVLFSAGVTSMVTLDPDVGPCYFVKVESTPEPTPSPGTDSTPGPKPSPVTESSPEPPQVPSTLLPEGEPSPEMDPDSSPEVEEDPEEDDGSVCFPADATVELKDGTTKTMGEINLGDSVKVGNGQFSDVFMFTHKDAKRSYNFVRIHTDSGAVLSATPGHYVYVNSNLAAARSVKVGDTLQLADGQGTSVTAVEQVRKIGLYNPQTLHGDIVVNSLKASTFTRTVNPPMAQAFMAPFRHIYSLLGWSASFLNNGADCLAPYVPHGNLIF